jgi:membrane protein implicated in regulation of membrane protease activity
MNSSSYSFGAYESARILIPGFYFAALFLAFGWAIFYAVHWYWTLGGIPLLLVFIVVSFVAGLTLYAKESTKRRKAFQENQPSLYLKTKARAMTDIPVMEEDDARQLYFFILNNHIPAVFHEKIFFFGTIYHIMIQIRRTSLWFAALGTVLCGIFALSGFPADSLSWMLISTAVVWALYLLNVTYNKADRKMQENYKDQIYWLQMNNDLVESILRKRSHTLTRQ